MAMRTSSMIASMAAVVLAGSASASVTYLTMTQVTGYPSSSTAFTTGTESAFTSEFNYQSSNNKVRMWNRSGGSGSPQQVVNPSNTYWGPDAANPSAVRPSRSWEISWNNTAKTFTTKVYDTTDWTGTASANLTLATVNTTFGGAVDSGAGDFTLRGIAQFASGTAFTGSNFYFRVNARVATSGNLLAGININTRPDGATAGVGSIVLSGVQFNGGNGFVSVGGADGTYNASGGQLNNYYSFAVVPAPGALALLGAAGLARGRRRRQS
jgi:MYXO-CTERM domain-containing protein